MGHSDGAVELSGMPSFTELVCHVPLIRGKKVRVEI